MRNKTSKQTIEGPRAAKDSGRKRDAKGHFLPLGEVQKKKSPKKKKNTKDESTVKIKIIKEAKPLPPMDFEGKLEDVKERTAISFIRSILAHKPNRIDIDGVIYYSMDIIARFKKALEEERSLNKLALEAIDESKKALEVAVVRGNELGEMQEFNAHLYHRKNLWKGLAISLAVGMFVGIGCSFCF